MSCTEAPILEIHTKVGDTVTRRLGVSDDLRPATTVELVIDPDGDSTKTLTMDSLEDEGLTVVVTLTPDETDVEGSWPFVLRATWPGDAGHTTYPQKGYLKLWVHPVGG